MSKESQFSVPKLLTRGFLAAVMAVGAGGLIYRTESAIQQREHLRAQRDANHLRELEVIAARTALGTSKDAPYTLAELRYIAKDFHAELGVEVETPPSVLEYQDQFLSKNTDFATGSAPSPTIE